MNNNNNNNNSNANLGSYPTLNPLNSQQNDNLIAMTTSNPVLENVIPGNNDPLNQERGKNEGLVSPKSVRRVRSIPANSQNLTEVNHPNLGCNQANLNPGGGYPASNVNLSNLANPNNNNANFGNFVSNLGHGEDVRGIWDYKAEEENVRKVIVNYLTESCQTLKETNFCPKWNSKSCFNYHTEKQVRQ